MKTIELTGLVPDTLTIYNAGEFVEEVDTTTITTLSYDITNGLWLFDNGTTPQVEFYLDDDTKCTLFDNLCHDNLYYFYTALDLIQHCPFKYQKGIEIYNELIKKLEDDCECLH